MPGATAGGGRGVARLDAELLKRLIAQRLPGGVRELQDRWVQLPCHAGEPDVAVPHRATVHRWSTGQVPRTSADLLRLCAVLDVDPLCLLTLPESDAELANDGLMRAYVHGRWEPPALEFLTEFLGRRSVWPPQAIARRYFGRDWFTAEVEHDADRSANYYATLRIDASPDVRSDGPIVYHVAFRHARLFARRWLQYGFVVRHDGLVRLRHINGYVDSCRLTGRRSPTLVQTWFGPGAATFRVASLHPFSLSLLPIGDSLGPAVRFPG